MGTLSLYCASFLPPPPLLKQLFIFLNLSFIDLSNKLSRDNKFLSFFLFVRACLWVGEWVDGGGVETVGRIDTNSSVLSSLARK